MSTGTSIEWTEATWNPTTGCDKVSAGCDNCYALTLAKRLKGMGSAKYQTDGDPRTSGPGFGLSMHDDALTIPLRWRKPRRIFVNSMSDLFHEQVTDQFIALVFAVMAMTPWHTYQVLTKRHGRLRSLLNKPTFSQLVDNRVRKRNVYAKGPTWPLPNVWLGVSVENQQWADIRIPALLETPAAVRWLSCEPLLGPIELPFTAEVDGCTCYGGSLPGIGHEPGCGTEPGPAWGNLHWVVTGGESGPGFRPADPDWFRSIRDQCLAAGVAFLHKQHGGRTPKAGGRELDGQLWDQYPSTGGE